MNTGGEPPVSIYTHGPDEGGRVDGDKVLAFSSWRGWIATFTGRPRRKLITLLAPWHLALMMAVDSRFKLLLCVITLTCQSQNPCTTVVLIVQYSSTVQ